MNQPEEKNWHIAILASGTGSNAVKIIEYLSARYKMKFSVYTNKAKAGVIQNVEKLGVKANAFDRFYFTDPQGLCFDLQKNKVDLVVLAGFLWLIPSHLVRAFDRRMINIHPSLLPKYGGKGMYGKNVHKAVKQNSEARSGITIHYVNEKYDDGDIILQASAPIDSTDSIEDIGRKVQKLEHAYFPEVVEELLQSLE